MTIEFDDGQLDRMEEILRKASKSGLDLKFAFVESVRVIKQASTANFSLVGNGKYTPLSPKYQAWKDKNFPSAKILNLTGRLKNSIAGKSSDSINIIGKDFAVIGTSVPHAQFIQRGTRKMDARPFLGLTKAIVDNIENVFLATAAEQTEKAIRDAN